MWGISLVVVKGRHFPDGHKFGGSEGFPHLFQLIGEVGEVSLTVPIPAIAARKAFGHLTSIRSILNISKI